MDELNHQPASKPFIPFTNRKKLNGNDKQRFLENSISFCKKELLECIEKDEMVKINAQLLAYQRQLVTHILLNKS